VSEIDNNVPRLPEAVVPWWQDGKTTSEAVKEPFFLSSGVVAYFGEKLWRWLTHPLRQTDPLTCSESLLNLHSWDTNINRFKGEPIEIYRKRVKYALINGQSAGSKEGFASIFERMGLHVISQKERQLGMDWDIITIELAETGTPADMDLLFALISQYGRTCRRYDLALTNVADELCLAAEFNCDWGYDFASMELD